MSINKSIIKSTYLISSGTVLSRILGFVRDIVIAGLFGTSFAAEAFVVAFRIPNLFRSLVGEGAINAAVVPVFSEYIVRKEKEDFLRLTNITFCLSFIVLSAITILGIIFSPLIVRVIAPGFINDVSKLNLAVRLTRIMFPYLVLIGLTAYSMGILHSFKSFFAPAFAPALLNISLIVSALIATLKLNEPIYGLAIGVLIGGVLQLALQLPSLYKNGLRFKKVTTFKHPGVKAVGSLLGPRIFGSAVYQLNIFVDTICASLSFIVGQGAVAAIYFANRIIQFPLAVFGIALASAALPTMSRLAAENDLEKLKDTLSFSLRSIFLIMMPSTVGLIILSEPIIRVFFQRGQFTAYSTMITTSALLFYALGLFAFAGIKILTSCFYSLKDTRSPVKVAGLCLIINVILNVILMFPLQVAGLALASSISALINFSILSHLLEKKIGRYTKKDSVSYILRVALISFGMGLVIYLLWNKFLLDFNIILRLATTVFCAVVVFIFGCFIFKVDQIKELFTWALKKK
ncbi:MAG: murein biosynthesis integral membrane protein MurJ [Candidatus Omnitrophota bacterium]